MVRLFGLAVAESQIQALNPAFIVLTTRRFTASNIRQLVTGFPALRTMAAMKEARFWQAKSPLTPLQAKSASGELQTRLRLLLAVMNGRMAITSHQPVAATQAVPTLNLPGVPMGIGPTAAPVRLT